MTQYNSLIVKLSTSQFNKLQNSAIKNKTEVVLRLSSSMVGDDETNFPHKLLLTNRQVANLWKAFADKSATDIKLSKNQMCKMIQSGGFLGRLLLKTGLPLMENVIKRLHKSVLIPLGLTAAAWAADAWIHKKVLGSGRPSSSASNSSTILVISNDGMKDIAEIVEFHEGSGLLPKGISETIQNEAKWQKGGFLSMLLGTLGASLLGNILADKGAIAKRQGRGINRAGEGIVRAAYRNKKGQKTTARWQEIENKMNF